MIDPEQPSDPGDRDASGTKLKSLRRQGLIDRRHNRGAKLNNQRQGGRGSRPLRSRPPIPAGGVSRRRPPKLSPDSTDLRAATGPTPGAKANRTKEESQRSLSDPDRRSTVPAMTGRDRLAAVGIAP